ncbi:MAG: DUF4339 domain-containing protein [Phycisphaerae bacterium]|nr:DUF4339 domain-containing protein [Phycisphaerae bacterium]
MSDWYCVVNGQQYGPITREQLQAWILAGNVRPTDRVWSEHLGDWTPASQVAELRPNVDPGATPPPPPPADGSEIANKKLVAGILAILLGTLGVHKFYLGYTTAGVIMLVVTVATCGFGSIIMWVIALIEGITYLTMPDAQFQNTYIAGEKAWF